MLQPDITITDGDKTLGSIWNKVLLKYSDLLKSSSYPINNFDRGIISSIDIRDIGIHDINIDEYNIKQKEKIDWRYILTSINEQATFMKYCKIKYIIRESRLYELIYISIFTNYFLMTKLMKYCNSILNRYRITDIQNKCYVVVAYQRDNGEISKCVSGCYLSKNKCDELKNFFKELREKTTPLKYVDDFEIIDDIGDFFKNDDTSTFYSDGIINIPYNYELFPEYNVYINYGFDGRMDFELNIYNQISKKKMTHILPHIDSNDICFSCEFGLYGILRGLASEDPNDYKSPSKYAIHQKYKSIIKNILSSPMTKM